MSRGLRSAGPTPEESLDGVVNDDVQSDEDRVNCELSESAMRYLEKLLANHEKRLTERFEKSELKLMDKISSLEKKITEKDNIIDALQSAQEKSNDKLAVVRAANDHLVIAIDDLQQYGRRYNVRLEGIEYDQKETSQQLKEKIEHTLPEWTALVSRWNLTSLIGTTDPASLIPRTGNSMRRPSFDSATGIPASRRKRRKSMCARTIFRWRYETTLRKGATVC